MSGCLTGCATEPTPVCQVFDPIYVSRYDVLTTETKRQIVEHNELTAILKGVAIEALYYQPVLKEIKYGS